MLPAYEAIGTVQGAEPNRFAMPSSRTTSTIRSLQGKSAAASRWDRPDKDELARDYAAEKLADYIRRTVDAAPPLTAEQRERLTSLLRPAPIDGHLADRGDRHDAA